jgi:N-acetylglutamate synthase/N-acetylornithine aminotransferase
MMRKLLFVVSFFSALVVFYSCSKSNTNTSPPASTNWTYDGITYEGYITQYDSASFPILNSKDTLGNLIYLVFNSAPTANSSYTVVETVTDSVKTSPYVSISINPATSNVSFISTGKVGDAVDITIVDGKLHATFSDCTITNFTETTTVSGTLIQHP